MYNDIKKRMSFIRKSRFPQDTRELLKEINGLLKKFIENRMDALRKSMTNQILIKLDQTELLLTCFNQTLYMLITFH